MEDHPRKRRKTSPLTSVTLKASNTPTRATSEDGSRSTPARAAFMSPTKSSLARFNPHLLRPPVSVERSQQGPTSTQSQIFGKTQGPESYVGDVVVEGISTAPQQKIQPVRVIGHSRESIKGEVTASNGFGTAPNGGRFHSSSRRSQSPLVEPLSAGQLQVIVERDPRASPPEAAGEKEKTFPDTVPVDNASGSQDTISEHVNSMIDTIENEIEQADGSEPVPPFTPTKNVLKDPEPRLPSTPSQLGLEAPPSPPKGLPFINPRRKLERKKRSKVKSSPLKPRAPSPATKPVETPSVSSLGPRIPVTSTQQSKSTLPKGRRKEAERLYVASDSAVSSLELTRHFRAASNSNSSIDVSRKPSTLSQRLALFLPFSKPPTLDPGTLPQTSTSQKDAGALHIDTVENIVHSATSNDPTLQHQSVVLTSPNELLVVEFQLNTDKEKQKVTDLTVTSISPWANVELGRWLQTEAVQLDKPTIERTVSRYWELSEIRAACWYRCEQDLNQKVITSDPAGDASSEDQQDTITLPTELHPGGRKNNPAPSPHPFPEEPIPNPLDTTTNNHDPSPKAQPIPRRSLHQHLGQQSMHFSRPRTTSLLISWRLTISPAGAVHSSLSAHAVFPEAWIREPGGEALGKVSEAFDLLVLEVGVFQAVKVIWSLIFGS
ncbi:hypothetical protein MMC22_009451 [Lobaria immixta]|nr:hypothetical protein [Lobaria immixta]